MATVDSSDMVVVAEFGVPLTKSANTLARHDATYGISLGVAGSAGGGGRLIKVGAFEVIVGVKCCLCLAVSVEGRDNAKMVVEQLAMQGKALELPWK